MDWCFHVKKPWIQMEQATIDPPLEGIVWLPDIDIPQSVKRHPVVGVTLRTAKRVFKTTPISLDPTPMTPVLGTLTFQPGMTDPCFKALL